MGNDADYSPRTLLVVDDEARILSAIKRALRREHYEIVTAETASEALRIVDERPIDAILSDQKMPGMSGLALLAAVAERQPGIVRMLITGGTEEISRERLAAVGVSALITKPWDDAKLKTTLLKVIPTAEKPRNQSGAA